MQSPALAGETRDPGVAVRGERALGQSDRPVGAEAGKAESEVGLGQAWMLP